MVQILAYHAKSSKQNLLYMFLASIHFTFRQGYWTRAERVKTSVDQSISVPPGGERMNPIHLRKSVRTYRSHRKVHLLAAAVLGCGLGGIARAQTAVFWQGTTGPYVDASNWSSNATPSFAANEFLMINNGGTATVGGTDAAQGNFLTLGANAGDTGNLQISGGSLTLGEFRVGGNETLPGNTSVSNM